MPPRIIQQNISQNVLKLSDIGDSHKNFIKKTKNKIKLNSKFFCRYIKTRRSNNNLPSTMTLINDLEYKSFERIVNAFADYFPHLTLHIIYLLTLVKPIR